MNTEHFKSRVVKTGGHIRNGSNFYEIVSTFRPSVKDIAEAQKSLGYDPRGYGNPVAVNKRQVGSKWVTTWESLGSCE